MLLFFCRPALYKARLPSSFKALIRLSRRYCKSSGSLSRSKCASIASSSVLPLFATMIQIECFVKPMGSSSLYCNELRSTWSTSRVNLSSRASYFRAALSSYSRRWLSSFRASRSRFCSIIRLSSSLSTSSSSSPSDGRGDAKGVCRLLFMLSSRCRSANLSAGSWSLLQIKDLDCFEATSDTEVLAAPTA